MGSRQSDICLRLLLFFHAVRPRVTYPIGQREKCHSRVEIGLWRDWTPGFDEPPRRQGKRKLMTSHHMEGWYKQTLMGNPVPAEDRVYTHCSGLQAAHLMTWLQLTRPRAHEKVHMLKQ